jgi:membrane fusion protein (multidrug efflux system)
MNKQNEPNGSQSNTDNKIQTNNTIQEKPLPVKRRSHMLIWFTCFLILAGIGWLIYWFLYLRFYESTDDAYGNGNLAIINSVIPGSVVKYFADDTDFVEEGQLLVLLDPTYYQIVYEKELSDLGAIVLQVRQLYDNVNSNQANVNSYQTTFDRTKYDFQNRLNLVHTEAISNEDFEHAQSNLKVAEFNLKQAEHQLKASQSAFGNTLIENHPSIEKQKSNVRAAYYNLQHCSIYAPCTGHVAKRSVEVGQRVSSQSALMAIIPTDYVWVDANFKETQLTYMRIGQPSTVWLDIYGSKVIYKGNVIGISSGTGSVFSIIPPQNATGNWIKIVQRLPVRISLDPEVVKNYPLRIGLSANVSVDITNQDLPMLALTPPTQPIAKTNIFDIQMEYVNQLIEFIVQENLKKPEPK